MHMPTAHRTAFASRVRAPRAPRAFALALLALLLAVAGLALAPPAPAHAASFMVTSCASSGTGSLDAAVAAANSGGGGTIIFTLDCNGGAAPNTAITLTNTLTPTQNVTIDGTAPLHTVTISGGNSMQLFAVNSGVTLTLTGLTLANGTVNGGGGAIYNNGGTVQVTGSTFTGNSATNGFGGAIYNQGTTKVTNSTFSGNFAKQNGGALFNSNGTIQVAGSTFSGNSTANVNASGGAIYNYTGNTITLALSVVAGNSAPFGPDLYGAITSGGGNVIGNTGSTSGFVASDKQNTDPRLAPLALNAPGATQTFALLPGSPAIDLLACPTDPITATTLATDARGVSRPQPMGGACDSGSFESRGFTTGTPTGNNQTTLISTAYTNPVGLTVSDTNTEPVSGGQVTFTITPGTGGASATFGTAPTGCTNTSGTVSVCTIGGMGVTTSPGFTANGTAGGFTIIASASGIATPFMFTETNNPPASPQAYIVTRAADDKTDALCQTVANGGCTLRQAVNASNATSGTAGNTITFAAGLTGSITLTPTGTGYGVLTLNRNVTIAGPTGATGITISGGNATQLFVVNSGVTASLATLTITGGNGNGNGANGGALVNNGTLTLTSSTFSGNTTAGSGGALFNNGPATVTGSAFLGNTSSNTGNGGGAIYNNGPLTVTGCTFMNNGAATSFGNGGAIFNDTQMLTVTNSTFTGNTSANKGGALYHLYANTVSIVGSTFTGNTTTTGGGGGGGGGAIYAYGPLQLTLTALAGNTAATPSDGNDLHGSVTTDGGGNVVGDTAGSSGFTAASDKLNVAPLLAPVALNAPGTVQTVAPLPGSPAIDIAPCTYTDANNMAQTLTTDARGVSRPQPAGGLCDSGSFESRGFTFTAPTGNNQTATISTAFATAPGITVAPVAAGEPVAGGAVTFTITAGGGGASGTFTGTGSGCTGSSTVAVCPIGVNGGATSPTITANNIAGSFTVTASAAGVVTPATYTLTNNAQPSPQTFIVTNTADNVTDARCNTPGSGGCTLREAINASHATSGTASNTITFAPGVTGTITLTAANGTLTLDHAVTITGPTGGAGITIDGGCTDCAPGGAGANGSGIRVLLVNSNITATLAGLTIADAHVRNSDPGSGNGGGIRNNGALTVTGCTFLNNRADINGGGIDANTGTLTVTNSTFSGNTANTGGGIANTGSLTVTNSTFSANTAGIGGGIANTGSLTMTNSLIVNSTRGGDVGGYIPDGTNRTGSFTFADAAPTDHGGPTATLALPPGSPAIDAATAPCPATDQRGVSRPQGAACDSGSFESQGFALSAPTGGSQSATVTTPFAAPLTLTVTSSHSEPITNGTITFTITPGTGGASGTFTPGGAGCTVSADRLTAVCPVNGSGVATAPTIKAGLNVGSFTVIGSTAGVPTSGNVTYTLTNTTSAGLITPQPSRKPSAATAVAGNPAPQPTPKATAPGTPAGTIAPQPTRH